jgi:tail tube protein
MPAVYPSALSFLGIGKESTAGTAVVPTHFMPWTEFKPKPNVELLTDEGMRGSMSDVHGAVMGKHYSELELSGVPFSDSFGHLLYNVLGGYAVTGAGPYTHTISLLNSGTGQPVTHTLSDRQGITASTGARVYPYACVEELTLKGNAAELLSFEAKITASASAAAGAAPTNAPPATTVTPAWRSSVSIGGTASPAVLEWEVTIKREIQVDLTADGTQNPWVIGRGPLGVEGKLTVRASDAAPLSAEVPHTTLIAGTQQALVIAVSDFFGGTSGHSLTLTMTKAQFSEVELTRDTMIGWEIGFKGIGNTTDAGASGGDAPIKAVLVNAVTTY